MTDPKPISGDDIEPIARSARLELSKESRDAAAPVLDFTLKLLDVMDEINTGETMPATAFDPRWSDSYD